jgi:ATP-dependent DNA helicase RecG
MNSLIQQLYDLIKYRESNHLEFKEAKNNIDSDKLTKYCCALANEGGGKIILGISDKVPRTIVGSQACRNLEKTKSDLISRLHLRIDVEAVDVEEKRVVILTIPARPIGIPIQYQNIYWMEKN